MTKFIRLNEANGRKCKLLINVAYIGSIQDGNDKDTYVRMCYQAITSEGKPKTEYYFVLETIEEIEKLLCSG